MNLVVKLKLLTCVGLALFGSNLWAVQLTALVTDSQGAPLEDAVVALVPEQQSDYREQAPAIMDQRNNMFTPKVLAIRANTLVRFPNSDDVRHHVYSFSPAKKFELRLYHGMTAEPVLFDQPGTVVLGCNIHDSMVAYIYVLETEYFAVTDANGKSTIAAPAGSYQLQVYHPRLLTELPAQSLRLTDSTGTQSIVLKDLTDAVGNSPTDEFSDLF